MSATSISVVDNHCSVLGISDGQIRHVEPSLSSTMWLMSCFLICIATSRKSSGRLRPSSGCFCRCLPRGFCCVLHPLYPPLSELFCLISYQLRLSTDELALQLNELLRPFHTNEI